MNYETRHLRKRGKQWYYARHVPKALRELDPREKIRRTLKTRSLILARERRDAMERADDEYWSALLAVHSTQNIATSPLMEGIKQQYKLAVLRATVFQLPRSDCELGATNTLLESLLKHLNISLDHGSTSKPPPARVSDAYDLYCEKIAFRYLTQKSPEQRKQWYRSKRTSIQNFITSNGDVFMSDIRREDALKFYSWWQRRLGLRRGKRRLSANGANRDIGNVRKFYKDYYAYFGHEDRTNPFRGLAFKAPQKIHRPCFDNNWVIDNFLCPDKINRIRDVDRDVLFVLIETGARPSEVVNLKGENIILDSELPFIKIRPTSRRELKTPAAARDIPLVGVAFEALRRNPNGFPIYRDGSGRLSQNLLMALRQNDLMPSPNHVIYSLRHSFERRMLEEGLDYGLRCRLMGHAVSRPDYGGGGSMGYKHEQLQKIAHNFSPDVFRGSKISEMANKI